tara:strand:- start:66 stop:530 length:465 start_codon:yes stop_codon:yes gene_type:complete
MTQSIKLSLEQIRLISLFQKITKTTARDCLDDEKQNRIIFVVNQGKMGLAIGRGGSNIKNLQNMLKRNIELVEYNEDPIKFLKNILNEKLISEIKLNTKTDGSSQAFVYVDPGKKGLVVGREGRNAEKARLLAKRYFAISNVLFNTQQAASLEM